MSSDGGMLPKDAAKLTKLHKNEKVLSKKDIEYLIQNGVDLTKGIDLTTLNLERIGKMENKSYEVLVLELLQQILNELKEIKNNIEPPVVNVSNNVYRAEEFAKEIIKGVRG
jgi:hypothetical protein